MASHLICWHDKKKVDRPQSSVDYIITTVACHFEFKRDDEIDEREWWKDLCSAAATATAASATITAYENPV
jgi:hypothetical protein